jgi:hypothetical protein
MPYTYTYPHEPLRPPRLLSPHHCWVVLAWTVVAAGLAASSAGTTPGRPGPWSSPVAIPGR